MYNFFDILLFLPFCALPAITVIKKENLKFFIFIFLFTLAVSAVRRVTNSPTAVVVICFAVLFFTILRKACKKSKYSHYIVISRDETNGFLTVSDGKNCKTVKVENCKSYEVGKIYRIYDFFGS